MGQSVGKVTSSHKQKMRGTIRSRDDPDPRRDCIFLFSLLPNNMTIVIADHYANDMKWIEILLLWVSTPQGLQNPVS